MATVNLGRVKPVNKGTWSSATTYAIDDFVQYTDNGVLSTYIAVAASTNQAPSTSGTENGTYWKYMSKGTSLAVGNNKVLVSDGSGNVTGQAIGTAGQVLKVNSGANGYEFGSGGAIKQRKFYYFADAGVHNTSSSWQNCSHPIGDGTLNITPHATGNIIEIHFSFFLGHNDTWQASTQRLLYSADGGSSYALSDALGGDGGYGGVLNYLQNHSRVGDVHSGTVYHVCTNTNNHKFKWQYYGAASGPGFYVNYNEGNNAGGTARSQIIITEYDATHSGITNGGHL